MGSKAASTTSKEATSLALLDAVGSFFRLYKRRMHAILSDISSGESSPSRVMVAVMLRKHGSLQMGNIAAYVGLPKSNITALVDDLEAEGILRRRRDEADRRVTHVELTAKGRTLCAREYDAYERSLSTIFDVLPEGERGAMLSGLERITQALKDDAGEEPESAKTPAKIGKTARRK